MEDYIKETLIASPYPFWVTIVIFAIISGLIQCIITYFKEKGKNLATKEDIAGITDKIKSVESKFINETEKLKSSLSVLANIQIDISNIERSIIIDFNRSAFTYINLIIHKRFDETSNKEIDEHCCKLEKAYEQANNDFNTFCLLINDDELKNNANELIAKSLYIATIKSINIKRLQPLNNEIQELPISAKEEQELKKKEFVHKLEQRLNEQTEEDIRLMKFGRSFQKKCRDYINKLINEAIN